MVYVSFAYEMCVLMKGFDCKVQQSHLTLIYTTRNWKHFNIGPENTKKGGLTRLKLEPSLLDPIINFVNFSGHVNIFRFDVKF